MGLGSSLLIVFTAFVFFVFSAWQGEFEADAVKSC